MKSRHSLIVRLTHWLAAGAMICMILSGWQIYNASPLLAFAFPRAITLGGWLGGAISWHLSAMWVLMAAGLIYLINGALTGHFRRDLAPTSAREVVNEIHFELTGDESAACDILGMLVAKKFKILEFRQTKANLEDIFMSVTKGGVQ